MTRTGKALIIIGWIIMIAFIVWIGASFIDIIADNCASNPIHSNYNFFNILVEIGEKING